MRDNCKSFARGIPSSTLSAVFPFVSNFMCDGYCDKQQSMGIPIGHNAYPVFLDFFKRDDRYTNSNMMIVGKSGGGKSYATKHLLANFIADGCRVFVLDPENEYSKLARNLGGRVIDVGQATEGLLNPFQMTVSLKDEIDEYDEKHNNTSYYVYLQFLESFFRIIFDGLTSDAFEYLNKICVDMYKEKGITPKTDIARLKPKDFPIFDDLYALIKSKLTNEQIPAQKAMLTKLEMYVSKFSTGGRNSALWNGYSTIEFDEQFVVFNFQGLLANKNNAISNAQMLLVLKILDNEIIKNMDYNRATNSMRRIVVTIDEAHTFIDPKYPIALDFMKETAKRIRKYNGMLQVITQNIKDFGGQNAEVAIKASAVINACQYSFVFGLNPSDMHDLVELYRKSCPINDIEAEDIANAGMGECFLITSPQNRSSIKIVATQQVVELFG
ncbi:MAG: ATP-binding protein [Clostridiales bacterium]|nr:ATP-binding protein [Clostridiales bacterium]